MLLRRRESSARTIEEVKLIRKLGHAITGFLYGFGFLLAAILVLGFFVGIPMYCGIQFGITGKKHYIPIGLVPILVSGFAWLWASKRGLITVRSRQRPEHPYKN